jgi:hypothetical protein
LLFIAINSALLDTGMEPCTGGAIAARNPVPEVLFATVAEADTLTQGRNEANKHSTSIKL